MNQRDGYIQKIQAKLDEWDAQINVMKAKAKLAEAKTKTQFYKQINDLEAEKVEVGHKIEKLRAAAEDSWEKMKEDIDVAWEAVEKSFKAAAAKF